MPSFFSHINLGIYKNFAYKKQDVFMKHGCPAGNKVEFWQILQVLQQSQNLANSPSLTF